MKRVWENDETGEVIEITAEGDTKWHELPYFFLSQVGFGTLGKVPQSILQFCGVDFFHACMAPGRIHL